MNEPWHKWAVKPPSSDFAARVAREARRHHLRRRARTVVAFGGTVAVAAAVLLFVAYSIIGRSKDAAIGPEESGLRPGSVVWPLSDGWEDETFDFPLPFAPSLPYRGAALLHFAPDFIHPGAPGYWSYVAVWEKTGVTGGEQPDPRRMEQDLETYYTGLCGVSGHPSTHTRSPGFESSAVHLSSGELGTEDRAAGGEWLFRGDAPVVDCIGNGGEIVINIEAVAGACNARTAFIAYAISPRPKDDPIWPRLRRERRAFDCRHPVRPAPGAPLHKASRPLDLPSGLPDSPPGHGVAWVLSAFANPPSEAEILERFTPAFISLVPVARIQGALTKTAALVPSPVVERVTSGAGVESVSAWVRAGDTESPKGASMRIVVRVEPTAPFRIAGLSFDKTEPSASAEGSSR